MTIESKIAYLKRLVKLAKKHHMSEYNYLEKIFTPEEHIGFQLYKTTSKTPKVLLYVLSLFLITSILSFILSKYFIKPRILGFIILYISISQLLCQILNEFLIWLVPTKVIPKLDYSKRIPKESKTKVVIPTIVSNEKKIKEMFDVL